MLPKCTQPPLSSLWFSFLIFKCHQTRVDSGKRIPCSNPAALACQKRQLFPWLNSRAVPQTMAALILGPSQHSIKAPQETCQGSREEALAPDVGRPSSTPLGTDKCKAKLTYEVANEMQKIIRRSNSETQANMLWRDGLGRAERNCQESRGQTERQQEYLQQKTEKFHLFSSPDAPTKWETGKRQTDGEKNHVKPGIFISSLVDVQAAKFFLWGEIQIKNVIFMNVLTGEWMIIRNLNSNSVREVHTFKNATYSNV